MGREVLAWFDLSHRVAPIMRILSGIQPSGALHIGNYFGAIRQYIDLQAGNDAFYFVADYHALTSVRDARAAPRAIRST